MGQSMGGGAASGRRADMANESIWRPRRAPLRGAYPPGRGRRYVTGMLSIARNAAGQPTCEAGGLDSAWLSSLNSMKKPL